MASVTEERLKERFFKATDYHAIPGGRKKLDYLFSVLARMRASRPKMKVLDVGCGNGAIAYAVASLGCDVLGVDVNRSSIEYARSMNPYPNARFQVVSNDDFDLNDAYDFIICSEVLEHLRRPWRLLATMARHMKADGLLLITVPNGYGPREILGRTEKALRERLRLGRVIDRARAGAKMMDAATKCAVHTSNPDQDHVQKFTMRHLRKLIANAGLNIAEIANSIFVFSVMIRTKSGLVDRFDSLLGDRLPRFMVSGWYILCRKSLDVQ
jgi:2-polyprenyl-3-methyl-5-hydroxy-6-metoxy-1,4-benzoquinol methylase